LNFGQLNEALIAQLISKVKTWNFSPRDMLQILKSMVYSRESNENFYELLSAEMLRKTDKFSADDFLESYYLLALAGINSKALAESILKKLSTSYEAIYQSNFFDNFKTLRL
jgi:hypothetical protein